MKTRSERESGVEFVDFCTGFERENIVEAEDDSGGEKRAVLVDAAMHGRVMAEILLAVITLIAHEEEFSVGLKPARTGTNAGTNVVLSGIVVVIGIAIAKLGVEVLCAPFECKIDTFANANPGSESEAKALRFDRHYVANPIAVVTAVGKRTGEKEVAAKRLRKADSVATTVIEMRGSVVGREILQIDVIVGEAGVTVRCRSSERSDPLNKATPITSGQSSGKEQSGESQRDKVFLHNFRRFVEVEGIEKTLVCIIFIKNC